MKTECSESVDSLANALEHDETQGDACQCEHHAEQLALGCFGGRMAIA